MVNSTKMNNMGNRKEEQQMPESIEPKIQVGVESVEKRLSERIARNEAEIKRIDELTAYKFSSFKWFFGTSIGIVGLALGIAGFTAAYRFIEWRVDNMLQNIDADNYFTQDRVASICLLRGWYPEALAFAEKSLKTAERLKSDAKQSKALAMYGSILQVWGKYDDADKKYEQALALAKGVDKAEILIKIGGVYQVKNDYKGALESCQEAEKIARQIVTRDGKLCRASALNSIGYVYYLKGKYQKAQKSLEASLVRRRRHKDRAGVATTLRNIGDVYCKLKEFKYANDNFKKSLEIALEMRDKANEAASSGALGKALSGIMKNETDVIEKERLKLEALDKLDHALTIYDRMGDVHGQAVVLHNFGDYHMSLGEKEEAREKYNQCIEKFKRIEAYGAIEYKDAKDKLEVILTGGSP
jgi:tetratricopeptide (TPR) repeat protein